MMIALPNKDKPKNAFDCSVKINPEERMCIYTGKVFEETLSLLLDRPCDDCPIVEIVTCEECKWFKKGGKAFGKCTYRTRPTLYCLPTDFCSYGERRMTWE